MTTLNTFSDVGARIVELLTVANEHVQAGQPFADLDEALIGRLSDLDRSDLEAVTLVLSSQLLAATQMVASVEGVTVTKFLRAMAIQAQTAHGHDLPTSGAKKGGN